MESFSWDKLQNAIKVRVTKFLPVSERARVALVGRSMRKACSEMTTKISFIEDGHLSEPTRSDFTSMLSLLRFSVYALGLNGKLSDWAQMVLKKGPCVDELTTYGLRMDVKDLASRVIPYWYSDASGTPNSGVFDFYKKYAWKDMAQYGKYLAEMSTWPQSRLTGLFYVLFDRPDGTIVVSKDLSCVYLVRDITTAMGELMQLRAHPYECLLEFLPFRGCIMTDGLINRMPVEIPPNLRRQLYRAYAFAVDSGTLITSLPLHPAPSPTAAPLLSPDRQAYLQQLASRPKPPLHRGGERWQFSCFDGKDGENWFTVISDPQGPVTLSATAAPRPTVLEIFDALCKGLFKQSATGAGGGMPCDWQIHTMNFNFNGDTMTSSEGWVAVKRCPCEVRVDEPTLVAPLQALLEPVGIKVGCIPSSKTRKQRPPARTSAGAGTGAGAGVAPTEKGEETGKKTGCAQCHAQEGQGGGSLLQCGRCRAVQYCSRDCQKKHWKAHKKDCAEPPAPAAK